MIPVKTILISLPLLLAAGALTAFTELDGSSEGCEPEAAAGGATVSCEFTIHNTLDEPVFVYAEGRLNDGLTPAFEVADDHVCAPFELDPDAVEGSEGSGTVPGSSGEATPSRGDNPVGQSDDEEANIEDEEPPDLVCTGFLESEAAVDLLVNAVFAAGCSGTLDVQLLAAGLDEGETLALVAGLADEDFDVAAGQAPPTAVDLAILYAGGHLSDEGAGLFEALIPALEEEADPDAPVSVDEADIDDSDPGTAVEEDEVLPLLLEAQVVGQGEEECPVAVEEDGGSASGGATALPEDGSDIAAERLEAELADTSANPDDDDNAASAGDPPVVAGTVPNNEALTTGTVPDTARSSGGDTDVNPENNPVSGTIVGTLAFQQGRPAIATGDGSFDAGTAGWPLLLVLTGLSVAVVAAPIVFWRSRRGDTA
ncbi:MAG: hypothetical protein GEU28_03760 [Dehalococcoidia bacterium]|nr:hypothetical protein [Dehalococcoidia bacterium]